MILVTGLAVVVASGRQSRLVGYFVELLDSFVVLMGVGHEVSRLHQHSRLD